MHAIPFAAALPEGGAATEPRADAACPRICVFAAENADAAALDALARSLPGSARVALIGDVGDAGAFANAERIAMVDHAASPAALVAAAAARFPGEQLILVRADARLPMFACERLLRALDVDGVLGALALDAATLGGLPDESGADNDRIDTRCFACSDRRLVDDAGFFAGELPPCSAWHGERLARLGAVRLGDRDAVDVSGLRIVRLDHLYVDAPGAETPKRPHADDLPPSPFAALRGRIAAADAATPGCAGLDTRPVLLHVLHGWGGGAERWVRDYAAADEVHRHLVLVARGDFTRRRHGEWLELHDGALDGPPLRRWPLPRPIADTALGDAAYRELFAEVVKKYCVDAVVVSSLIGHSLDALRSGLPLICVVHDHYPLWPALHRDFGDAALAFDADQRAVDLASAGADAEFANRDPAHWLALRDATVAALTEANATLIAPTQSALANQLRLAPELGALPSRVIAHGLAAWPVPIAPTAPPARPRLRLLVPGRVRRGKGAELLTAVLPRLREQAELFLLGAGADAHALFGEADVHILLDYRRDELPQLTASLRPDAALLLPTVAETFSYTLSEMRSLGLPVIATRVGALAERIDDGIDGFLVDADAQSVVARIAALSQQRDALQRVRDAIATQRVPTTAEAAQAYADVLQLGPRPPARYPLACADGGTLENTALVADIARLRTRERMLREDIERVRRESERRGEWGHALDRDLARARQSIDTAHAELEERTRWAQSLDAELQDLKPRHEQLLAHQELIFASASWRLTAPLRSAKTRLRNLRASLAYRSLHLRSQLGRVRGSVAQRGIGGTLKRIIQELRHGRPSVAARVVYAEPGDDFAPFALPVSDTPRVSIVIPVYNKIAYTIACLRSIAEHAGEVPFEVIVVDDGSGDATPERLAEVTGLRTLRNAQNLGFIGSCNAGAAMSHGDYVLFLNNDTVVTAGWLEALVHCIEDAPQAGLVGARLVYPDGRLQEAGGIVFNDGSGWNYGRFDDPDDPRYGFRREADYCSGAAILLRRDLFEKLGRFDARYTPAYYEDTDLAFAVRAAGLKVYYEPAATVVHFEGITSGTDTASGTKRYQVVNREKFLEKWKDALARQPAPGTPIGVAATHRATRRVLIVDATTPTPDQDSGSLRMVNLMRVLASLGCQTTFLPDNRAQVERYTAALQSLGIEVLYGHAAADPVRVLRERGTEFDLVVLSRHYIATSYVGLVRLHAPQAILAFDTVDLHYLREQRAAALSGQADLVRHAEATRAHELKLVRECDVTLVVSPVEQELLAREVPGARVDVLSNVHEVHGNRRPFAERCDLVFIGGFQHPPNTDAVTWFVQEVFPRVRAELAEVSFHVIGSKVPDAIRDLAGDGVVVHGFVEDIEPFMDGCRISVAPLRYGAGVKGKVNMAMSYGLPVVATPIAVEGMHVRAGDDVLVAEEAAAFAEAIVRLYRDEALWNRLSANGLANVERHFSFAAAAEAVRRLFAVERRSGR